VLTFKFLNPLLNLLNGFGPCVGIDLGTSNTPIFVRGKGIVFSEPSYVAVNNNTGKVIAVGKEAKEMLGRTPAHISVIRPLRDGVIANFEIAYEMLKHLLQRAVPNVRFLSPRVIIGIPSDCTPVERRAVEEAAFHAGGRKVLLAAQPFLAAIGAKLPVKEAVGSMVVDIGGGTAEIAIMSLGGIVSCQSLRVAGDKMDEAINAYIKKNYSLVIGERTAEEIKIKIGSVSPKVQEKTLEIRGRDVFSGLPRSQIVTNHDVREALLEPISAIIDAVRGTLERSPPELIADIMQNGIAVAGGGALLDGLPQLIQEATGVPCWVPEDPIHAVALGAGMLFEDYTFLKEIAARGAAYWEHPVET
jgi:rod shape-determining protein MreB